MKHIILISICLASLCAAAQSKAKRWTMDDRQVLLVGLDSTQKNLEKELAGLTDKQVLFKPDSTQWSIAEVVEHLGIYEELLYWDLLNNQYTPEMPDLANKVKGVDSVMIAYTNDPLKLKAPFVAEPLGRFHTKKELLNFFNRFRDAVATLIKETPADLRLHFVFRAEDAGVWRVRDLHQYTLLWIAHTERHTNQIRRVKASPNFPK